MTPTRQRHHQRDRLHRPHRPAGRRTAPRSALPQGLGAVSILLVLVALAGMAAAVLRLGIQGADTLQQDVQGTRASVAARAGVEWGLYQALKGSWTSCSSASQTLDLSADTGMRVLVSCDSTLYNEGESAPDTPATVRLFTIDAVACNSTACPDATAAVSQGYVERRRQVTATN